MKTPNKSISFSIENNEYSVLWPNNGQFIEIESMKLALTRDTYNSMLGGNISSQYAKYTVDMIAFLSVCCPKLKKDLNVESFSELDMLSSKKILNVYIKTILPWITEWENLLNSLESEITTPVNSNGEQNS